MKKPADENPKDVHISSLLLERYHIGEVTHEEKLYVEKILKEDATLAAALANLDKADIDFHKRFPKEIFFSALPASYADQKPQIANSKRFSLRNFFQQKVFHTQHRIPPIAWGLCAAALVMLIAFPMFILKNPSYNEFSNPFSDRIKGTSIDNSSIELNVYLKGNSSNEVILLQDQSIINAGNTVQLIYKVADANTDAKYGVIFSIDGRSSVTMHYPYTQQQSTLLISGKSVHLDEAFTLDDAPDYEIFFFVTGDTPLDVKNILNTAQQLAGQIKGKHLEAKSLGAAAFNDYIVKTFTLIKNKERKL